MALIVPFPWHTRMMKRARNREWIPFPLFEIDFQRLLWFLVSLSASMPGLSISNYSRAARPWTASSSITKQCGVVHFPTSISGAENWKIMSLSPLTSGALHALFIAAHTVVADLIGGGGKKKTRGASRARPETTRATVCRIKIRCIIGAIRSRAIATSARRKLRDRAPRISRDTPAVIYAISCRG